MSWDLTLCPELLSQLGVGRRGSVFLPVWGPFFLVVGGSQSFKKEKAKDGLAQVLSGPAG